MLAINKSNEALCLSLIMSRQAKHVTYEQQLHLDMHLPISGLWIKSDAPGSRQRRSGSTNAVALIPE